MKRYCLPIALLSFAPLPLIGEQLTVSIDAFGDPTTFSITEGNTLNLRVSELMPAPGTNASTHVLVEGLSPLEEGTLVYASPYQGINSSNGEVQDTGVVFLEMPEAATLPAGTVSSPIVGVLQRAGSWNDYSLSLPTTSLGGASGASTYDSGSLDLTLVRGAETFTGSTTYTVVDEDTIELEAMTLVKDGGTSIDVSGAMLLRDGLQFAGTVTNLSPGAAYDSLLFAVRLTNIPDLDSDGIPDISDDSVEPVGLVVGDWNRLDFSWVYGFDPDWGVSTYMGYVYVPFYPYVYQVDLGWLYLFSSNGNDHYFYSWDLESFILINEGFGGFYYIYNTDDYTNRIPQP
jgi:hypothetical protein